tara:strand:+ start:9158 stop:9337 length:180 start_codon:yes stop_codon:yes gene_type:complete
LHGSAYEKETPHPPLRGTFSLKGRRRAQWIGKRGASPLPLRERVDRPQAETGEGSLLFL